MPWKRSNHEEKDGPGRLRRYRFRRQPEIEGLHRVYGTDAEFVSVHSRNRDKAAAFADTHGSAVFDDLDDLLEKIDVLHMVALSSLRESLAITLRISLWAIAVYYGYGAVVHILNNKVFSEFD